MRKVSHNDPTKPLCQSTSWPMIGDMNRLALEPAFPDARHGVRDIPVCPSCGEASWLVLSLTLPRLAIRWRVDAETVRMVGFVATPGMSYSAIECEQDGTRCPYSDPVRVAVEHALVWGDRTG